MNLKPTHKAVKDYYTALDQYARLGITNETSVRSACQYLLESCARQERWSFVTEYSMTGLRNKRISVDGALIDESELARGYWEAKDMNDDLPTEIRRKFDKGYPRDNILFQTPERAILWQNEREVLDADLTERIFRTVFDNPDFTRRNVIASEIENVIDALTSQSFSRDSFLQRLDRFYVAIERNAVTITDFSRKQAFLNTVYEQFFQGFSVKVADTHGIVYTPQPIVDFMVKSVEHILRTEFKRSLSDSGVHIIDPFVGTGNFIVRIMREISGFALADKYRSELHCNEVMLLPYYIASMNIEHQFFEMTGHYQPFEKICLVDTFALLDHWQLDFSSFTEENAKRVEEQKDTPMFVIIGNPPYNMGQVNENDNNKNRKYKTVDKEIAHTYAKHSTATNKNALSDAYVKAIWWASDRIGDEGIVAFVTNNGFLEGVAFDGMRKHLEQDFTSIYHIDLKGNARTSGERRKKEGGNIFDDQIRVGIGISFFIRKSGEKSERARVWIYSVNDYLKARDKQKILLQSGNYTELPMREATSDANYTWLTQGLRTEFETFVSMGNKVVKSGISHPADVIFKSYSRGINTSRDTWVYNFNRDTLIESIKKTIATYNAEVLRWKHRENRDVAVDDFVAYDDAEISWSESLKQKLQRGKRADFSASCVRRSLYRPFTKSNVYFARTVVERVYVFPSIFPSEKAETQNRAICVTAIGNKKPFHCLATHQITDVHLTGDSQCFPFYTYDEDGTNRRENITDWALAQFRTHYCRTTKSTSGTFSITFTAYCIIPPTGSGMRQTSSETCRGCLMPPTSVGLPTPVHGWRKSMSATKMFKNIRAETAPPPYSSSKPPTYPLTGVSSR